MAYECRDVSILYVEDEYEVREQTGIILKRNFNTVIVAGNGKEGLDLYKNSYFDIVITDIKMPVMDGVEMIQKIREISPDQIVMVISAFDFSDMLHPFLKKDVNYFIQKPYNIDNLISIVTEVCVKRKEVKEIKDNELTKDEIIDILKKRILELERKIVVLEDRLGKEGF